MAKKPPGGDKPAKDCLYKRNLFSNLYVLEQLQGHQLTINATQLPVYETEQNIKYTIRKIKNQCIQKLHDAYNKNDYDTIKRVEKILLK